MGFRIKAFFNKEKEAFLPSSDISSFLTHAFSVKPKKIELYKQAFTHKSMSKSCNNERMEYLGDTILSSVVASYLYSKFPNKNEGELTILTSKIVTRKHLNFIGEQLQLDSHLIAIEYENGHHNILGNTLEAIIGAIYLDQGYEKTKKAIYKAILKGLDLEKLDKEEKNFKSILIVWGQKTGNKVVFKGKKLSDSNKYKSTLYINGKKLSSTAQNSKKQAEQIIAEQALSSLTLAE